MQILRIDHVGVAVADLDEAKLFYERTFGLTVVHEETNEEQGIREALLTVGESEEQLQLIAPLNADSPVAKFLDHHGPGVQHVAWAVANLKRACDELLAANLRVLYDKPKRGTRNRLINFIHPKDTGGVLIELIQEPLIDPDALQEPSERGPEDSTDE